MRDAWCRVGRGFGPTCNGCSGRPETSVPRLSPPPRAPTAADSLRAAVLGAPGRRWRRAPGRSLAQPGRGLLQSQAVPRLLTSSNGFMAFSSGLQISVRKAGGGQRPSVKKRLLSHLPPGMFSRPRRRLGGSSGGRLGEGWARRNGLQAGGGIWEDEPGTWRQEGSGGPARGAAQGSGGLRAVTRARGLAAGPHVQPGQCGGDRDRKSVV